MRYGMIFILCLMWATAQADWTLDKSSSTLSYVSIKNNDIGEINYFKNIDANIKNDGIFTMIVNLDSIDTRYAIRDQRMQKLFFETNKYAVANIKGRMPVKKLRSMFPGSVKRFTVRVLLSLHGHQEEVEANLRVVKMAKNGFIAMTENPILLNVQAFDLTEGIKRLIDVAKLNGITWVVPVTFALVFK